jgi:polyphosphate kinase
LRIRGKGQRSVRASGFAAALLAGLVAATPGRAHPHVFIDGGVDFLFDDSGELARLRITWIYDPMTSLFILEDLGIDAAKPLSPDDRVRLAAYDTVWDEGYDGDSYLRDQVRRIGLSTPKEPDAGIRDGRVVVTFLRDLDVPYRPGADTRVDVYDPTYYMAYTITDAPRLEGSHDGCRAEVVHFEPTKALASLQQSLAALSAEQTPEQDDVGASFAEKVHLACD